MKKYYLILVLVCVVLLSFGCGTVKENKEAIKDSTLDHKSAGAYYKHGNVKFDLKQYGDAIKDYDKAIRLAPKDACYYRARGDAKYKLDQYKEAIKDYNKAIELDSKSAFSYCVRGCSKTKLKQYKEARVDLLKAKKLAEEQKKISLFKIIEKKLKELDEDEKKNTIKGYGKAGIVKNLELSYAMIGLNKYKLKQYKEALNNFDKAIELNPKFALPWHYRGMSKEKLGQPEEAMKSYDRAIELNPEYVLPWFYRGMLKCESDQYKEAIKDYNQAIKLDPKNAYCAYCYRSRGYAKFKLEQYEEAIKDFDKAIELNPTLACAYASRGFINFYIKQQYKDARIDLLKAKELAQEQKNAILLKTVAKNLQELDEAEKKAKK